MPYTVSVPLSWAWLLDPADPLMPVVSGSRHTSDSSFTLDGEFRKLAGGRTQLVLLGGDSSQIPFVMSALTREQFEVVESWAGRLLLLRTWDGERWWGSYLSVAKHIYQRAGDDPADPFLFDASFTFQVVSFDEAV